MKLKAFSTEVSSLICLACGGVCTVRSALLISDSIGWAVVYFVAAVVFLVLAIAVFGSKAHHD